MGISSHEIHNEENIMTYNLEYQFLIFLKKREIYAIK